MPISRRLVEERTEELRQANESLRQIDETRRGFFADISHELRTPLTVIRGEGEIALRGPNKRVAEYKRSIERIVEQAKHLSVLVNDLLFIARQGAGAARLNMQPIDLGDLLAEGLRRRQGDRPRAERGHRLRQRRARYCARRPGAVEAAFPCAP